jgi:hypothetical protein
MRGLLLAFGDPDYHYHSSVEVLQVHVHGEAALVHTRESGTTTKGKQQWEDVQNLWHVQRLEGRWRLVGQVHNLRSGF